MSDRPERLSQAFRRHHHSTYLLVEDALLDGLGDLLEAVYLSKLLYWDQYADEDGWFTRTVETIQRVTKMTRRQQDSARKSLVEKGLLEVARRGIPAQLHYRIHWNAMIDLIADTPPRPEGFERDSFDPEATRQTRVHENAKLDRTRPAPQIVRNRQSLTSKNQSLSKENQRSPSERKPGRRVIGPPPRRMAYDPLDPRHYKLIVNSPVEPRRPADLDPDRSAAWDRALAERERKQKGRAG